LMGRAVVKGTASYTYLKNTCLESSQNMTWDRSFPQWYPIRRRCAVPNKHSHQTKILLCPLRAAVSGCGPR
jgi:hypothetical protein